MSYSPVGELEMSKEPFDNTQDRLRDAANPKILRPPKLLVAGAKWDSPILAKIDHPSAFCS